MSKADVDAYIESFDVEIQEILQTVRAAIRRAVPDADEVISYRMPAFKQHGIIVYYAAWKNHIGLYPPIAGDKSLEKAVSPYAGPKGNLQFPIDKPMPVALIERIAKHRWRQIEDKRAIKRSRK